MAAGAGVLTLGGGNKKLVGESTEGERWSKFWNILFRNIIKWTYEIYLMADKQQQVSQETGLTRNFSSIKMYISIKNETYERLNKLN